MNLADLITSGGVGVDSQPGIGYDAGYARTPVVPTGQGNLGNTTFSSAPQQAAPSQAPQIDYAAQQAAAQAAAQAKLLANFNQQKSNILNQANTAVGAGGSNLSGSISDLLDSLNAGQTKVNNQAIQNDLAKQQGTQGVLSMVGKGIKSGGVMLANKNAGDSSGAEAIARAYGDLGRQQLSGVGNQYAQGQNAVQQAQTDLDLQRAAGVRHTNEAKANIVNNIIQQAQQSLSALQAAMGGASLGDKINIQNEIDAVKASAMGQLQQYDSMLQSGLGGIQASSEADRRKAAQNLATAGTAADNAYKFTNQVPGQFQNTGPFATSLPIFTYPGSKKQGA